MAPVPPFSEFQVGWICALKAEFEAATLMLDEEYGHPEVTPPNDSNMYLLGRIGKHNVVVTLLAKFGTTTSAVSISNMIRTFSSGLRFALMVGIGGGIPAPPAVDIRLADVVVGYPNGASPGVVQYDMLKQTLSGSERIGALNNPPPLLLSFAQAVTAGRAKHRYLEHVQRALEIDDGEYMETMGRPGPRTDRLFEAEYDHPDGQLNCDRCLPEREIHRDPRKNGRPRVHYGTIASGNSVIKNAARREELRVLAGGALCFEMEAAGMVSEFPCLVIRGICDYADSHKHKAWQGYAALVAASFTKELLLRVSAEGVAQQELIVKVLGKPA
ncbi:nucleoside phosphorylase domain-containing protein [Aspergillus karnatakaensis]|uniref:5'-methylthioadenosine/S-adenosylhomocysteine nucleosidase family protein n=1 Tax=Aspergillus karnatakaensis TaxID=1810916 RepID=UPI003CCD9B75